MKTDLNLVKFAAQMRGEKPLDDMFLQRAKEMIDSGEVKVERYPMGHPTATTVFDLAKSLEATSRN
jgi:hypothetical protein